MSKAFNLLAADAGCVECGGTGKHLMRPAQLCRCVSAMHCGVTIVDVTFNGEWPPKTDGRIDLTKAVAVSITRD